MAEVLIPTGATTEQGDLAAPLDELLQRLGLGVSREVTSWRVGTPDSVAVIKAGATNATKAAGTAIAALGGGGSLAAAVLTWTKQIPEGFRTPTVYAVGIVALGTILGLAWVVSADVRGRADATTAQLQQRAAVAVAWLNAVQAASARTEASSDASIELTNGSDTDSITITGDHVSIRRR